MRVLLAAFLLGLILNQTTGDDDHAEAEKSCLNSDTFELRHLGCMKCNCNQLKRMSEGFVTKMCRMNRWDMSPDLPGTRQACCHLCKNYVNVTEEICDLYLECPSREKGQGFCGFADLTIVGRASSDPSKNVVSPAVITKSERFTTITTTANHPAFSITFGDTMYATGDMCLKLRLELLPAKKIEKVHIDVSVGDNEESFRQRKEVMAEDVGKIQFNIQNKTQIESVNMIISYPRSYYDSVETIETMIHLMKIDGCSCQQ